MRIFLFLAPASLLLTSCSLVSSISEGERGEASISLSYLPEPQGQGSDGVLAMGEEQRLSDEAWFAMKQGYREVCGKLLLNSEGKIELAFSENSAHNPHSYEISHESALRLNRTADLTNRRMVGTFHSHPATYAIPSVGDLAMALPDTIMMIYSVPTRRTRLWRLTKIDGRLLPVELNLKIEQPWEQPRAKRGAYLASRKNQFLPSKSIGESSRDPSAPRPLRTLSPATPLRTQSPARPYSKSHSDGDF